MIITVKNLKQQTFRIDFDPEKSVKDLKEKIFTELGSEYIVENQKLIYAGAILEDERTVATYNVDEERFIVVILKRDHGAKKTEEPATSAEEEPQSQQEQNETAATSKPPEVEQKVAAGSQKTPVIVATTATEESCVTAPASLQVADESPLLMCDECNQLVKLIVQMGYTRALTEATLAARFNNPDRSVENLLIGIPVDSELSTTASSEVDQRSANESSVGEDSLEFLRNQPQILQIRELVHQNPELLNGILQQITQLNPALLQLISENEEAFLDMLTEPLENYSTSSTNSSTTVGAAAADQPTAASRAGASGDGESASTVIQMTDQDREAISRLKAMGFPEQLVLAAYFACERDENQAANLLISSEYDD